MHMGLLSQTTNRVCDRLCNTMVYGSRGVPILKIASMRMERKALTFKTALFFPVFHRLSGILESFTAFTPVHGFLWERNLGLSDWY